MKPIILFSFLALSAVACNNSNKTEAQESMERDSMDNVQKSIDQRFVDSLEQADMQQNQEQGHDHDHSDPNHKH